MEVCIVLCIHFRKAEAAYRRPQTLKPWLELYIFQLTYLNDETTPRMMLESCILPNICPCYFSLRISMDYTENVTELLAHA